MDRTNLPKIGNNFLICSFAQNRPSGNFPDQGASGDDFRMAFIGFLLISKGFGVVWPPPGPLDLPGSPWEPPDLETNKKPA